MRTGNGLPTCPRRAHPRAPNPTSVRRDTRGDARSTSANCGRGQQTPTAQGRAPHHRGVRAKLKVASLNIKGRNAGGTNKWFHIPQVMREGGIGLMAVQETHLTDELAGQFRELFKQSFELVYSPDPTTRNAKGVAFVINKGMIRTEDMETRVLIPGRAMTLTIPWKNGIKLTALNVYAPNCPKEMRQFWKETQDQLRQPPTTKPDIMMGDFNLVEDALDRIPSSPGDVQAIDCLRETRNAYNLVDGWRRANIDQKGYTWSRESDGAQSRLDWIYIREDFMLELAMLASHVISHVTVRNFCSSI